MFIYFNLMRRLQKLNALLPHAHAHATPQGTHMYTYVFVSQLGDAAVSVFASVINFPATRRMRNEGKL